MTPSRRRSPAGPLAGCPDRATASTSWFEGERHDSSSGKYGEPDRVRHDPASGLVLFGEPATAKKFYERAWRPSLDRLAKAWSTYYDENGVEDYPDTEVAARITFGACLMYALDARYAKGKLDTRAAAQGIAEAAFDGMWLRGT